MLKSDMWLGKEKKLKFQISKYRLIREADFLMMSNSQIAVAIL